MASAPPGQTHSKRPGDQRRVVRQPVEDRIREDDVNRRARSERAQVCTDPFGFGRVRSGLGQHFFRAVDADDPRVRPALSQHRRRVSGTASEVDGGGYRGERYAATELERGPGALISELEVQGFVPLRHSCTLVTLSAGSAGRVSHLKTWSAPHPRSRRQCTSPHRRRALQRGSHLSVRSTRRRGTAGHELEAYARASAMPAMGRNIERYATNHNRQGAICAPPTQVCPLRRRHRCKPLRHRHPTHTAMPCFCAHRLGPRAFAKVGVPA